MNIDQDNLNRGDPLREFALACRAERDRRARLHFAEEDRRFESGSPERCAAELQAARAIAVAAR